MNAKTPRIDPVCRMTVPKGQMNLTAEFSGTTYYFCTAGCRDQFLSQPARYSRTGQPKRKGFWQRYLDRLKKSTGGKPPSCCG